MKRARSVKQKREMGVGGQEEAITNLGRTIRIGKGSHAIDALVSRDMIGVIHRVRDGQDLQLVLLLFHSHSTLIETSFSS